MDDGAGILPCFFDDETGLIVPRGRLDRGLAEVFGGWAMYERVGCTYEHRGVTDDAGARLWLEGKGLEEIPHMKVAFRSASR